MMTYPDNWHDIAKRTKDAAGWKCVRCHHPHDVASGHVLTVHHLDGNKANCETWNLAALCQRCHLHIQAKVDMDQGFLFEHSDWMKPFVEGRRAAMATAIHQCPRCGEWCDCGEPMDERGVVHCSCGCDVETDHARD